MDIHNLYRLELDKVDNGKGYWDYIDVKVINTETDKVVAEYQRNYGAMYDTFFPFEQNGKHYALVAPHYTATSVISLDTGEIVAKEEANAYGFCPVGFYVPRYWISDYKSGGKVEEMYVYEEFGLWNVDEDFQKREGITPDDIQYTDFGFVSGCVWGDDISWKLQWLDLSDIENGVIGREPKFGYVELPHNQKIWEAIDIQYYDELTIYINTFRRYYAEKEDGAFKYYSDGKGDWIKIENKKEQEKE